MGLSVSERVHVMPVGYEYDRIIEPAKEFRADLVILIGHHNNDEYGEACWKGVKEALTEENIEYVEETCDIFSLYSSLATITAVIAGHRDDDVYVNISSGSKITAIAGMIASMVMDSRPYYAKAATYGSPSESLGGATVPKDIEDVLELPKYPIDAPDKEQVNTLEFISMWSASHSPPTKGKLIHFGEKANLSYIRANVAGKGKYRLLDKHILGPLLERDWIVETKEGRSKVVSLTEEGAAALTAFRWMEGNDEDIESVVREIEENEIED